MTHFTDPDIRLRPDGSIDTAYYLARGRQARSDQARKMVKSVFPDKRSHHGLRALFSL